MVFLEIIKGWCARLWPGRRAGQERLAIAFGAMAAGIGEKKGITRVHSRNPFAAVLFAGQTSIGIKSIGQDFLTENRFVAFSEFHEINESIKVV